MSSQGTKRAKAPELSAEQYQQDPTHQQILSLAHALWELRGCPEGSPEEDWLQAEKELTLSGIQPE